MYVTTDILKNHFCVRLSNDNGRTWRTIFETMEVSDYAFQKCILIMGGFINAGFSYAMKDYEQCKP